MDSDNQKHFPQWIEAAMQYFNAYFKQRLLHINLFIIIATSLTIAAYFSTKLCGSQWVLLIVALCVLAILMLSVTFIFWHLELKTRCLIMHSKKILKELEGAVELPDNLRLFSNEKKWIRGEIERKNFYCKYFISYEKCIRALLIMTLVTYLILLFIIGMHSNKNCSNSGCSSSQQAVK